MKTKSLFYKIYFSVIAVFLVLLTIGLFVLNLLLKAYEAAQPVGYINNIITEYFQKGDLFGAVEHCKVYHSDIGAYLLDILCVNQRICVVVGVCEEYCVLFAALKQTSGVVFGGVLVSMVVIVKVFEEHKCRNEEKDWCNVLWSSQSKDSHNPGADCKHSHCDPDCHRGE